MKVRWYDYVREAYPNNSLFVFSRARPADNLLNGTKNENRITTAKETLSLGCPPPRLHEYQTRRNRTDRRS